MIGIHLAICNDRRDSGTVRFLGNCRDRLGLVRGDDQDIHLLADQVSYLLYLCLVIVLRVLYNNFHVIIVGGFDTHIVNHGLPPSIVQHTLGEADNVLLLFPRACAATQDDQG